MNRRLSDIAAGRDRRDRSEAEFWGYSGAVRRQILEALSALGHFREAYDEQAGQSTLPQVASNTDPDDAPRLVAITAAIDTLNAAGDFAHAEYLFQEREHLVPVGYSLAVGGTAARDTLLQMGSGIGIIGGDSISGPSLTTTGQGVRWALGGSAATIRATGASSGRATPGPKPAGTGPHNLTVKSTADSVADGKVVRGGQTGLPEAVVATPGGLKGSRRPDILVERADGSVYGINVGLQSTRTGAPIKREAEAISDLEWFAGLEMHFVAYNVR